MAETRRIQDELNGVRDIVGRISEDVGVLSDRAKKAGKQATHAVSEFSEDALDRGRKAARYAANEVKEHPIATLAIGAAVGLLVTALLTRR